MFSPNLIVGLAIMAIGVLLVLDRLGFAGVMDVLSYWPILLVLFGASVAVQSLRPRDPSLPPQRPVVSPGLVLLVVIIAILGTFVSRSSRTEASSGPEVTVFGVMGSTMRTTTGTFRSANVGGVMGRSTLDLRQATIAPGTEAVVDVFAAMGKVVIRVPDGWTVDTSALPVMGAVEDLRWPSRDEQPATAPEKVEPTAPADVEAATPAAGPPPRLVLRGFVMMGKVEIRS